MVMRAWKGRGGGAREVNDVSDLMYNETSHETTTTTTTTADSEKIFGPSARKFFPRNFFSDTAATTRRRRRVFPEKTNAARPLAKKKSKFFCVLAASIFLRFLAVFWSFFGRLVVCLAIKRNIHQYRDVVIHFNDDRNIRSNEI